MFACRPNISYGLVVSPLPGGSSNAEHAASVTVTLRFIDDGTVDATKTTLATWNSGPVGHNWFSAPVSGVGAGYWVRATVTGGSLTGGTTGSWLQLSTTRTWFVTRSSIGSLSCTLTIEIATDSGGTNIVGTGSYSIQAAMVPP